MHLNSGFQKVSLVWGESRQGFVQIPKAIISKNDTNWDKQAETNKFGQKIRKS